MSFSTTLGDNLLAIGDNSIAFGTCMLGASFGQVKSCTLKRAHDRDLILNCKGNLRAAVLKMARLELNFKTIFDEDVEAPGLGEILTFPYAPVTGRVLAVSIDWGEGERTLDIEATSWDANLDIPAWLWDGTAYTPHNPVMMLEGGGMLELEGGGGIDLHE